jgi:hypothetical protein
MSSTWNGRQVDAAGPAVPAPLVVAGAVAAALVLGFFPARCPAAEPAATAKSVHDYAGQERAPAGTKRVMFIAAKGGHGGRGSHEFNVGGLYLARTLNAVYPQAWAVVHTDDRWPEACANQDAIVVLLNHGGRAAADPRIADAIRRRAGFMAIHFGVEVEKGPQGDAYLDWIGGYFEQFWSVNPHWKAAVAPHAGHPTARGLAPFTLDDEWYYHMRFRDGMKGVTPILSAVPPPSTVHSKDNPTPRGGNPDVWRAVQAGAPQHLAWAYERPDGGRGYGFTGYHVFANLGDDSFRTALLNGAAWVAGLEVPERGVPSAPLSAADLEAMLDEVHGPRLPAPVAHWTFDEEGPEAIDRAGGHKGAVTGATPHPGKFGKGLLFDRARRDHVSVPYAADLEISSFTVSAWVRLTKPPTFSGILGTRQGGAMLFDVKVNADKVHGDIGDGERWIDTKVNFYAADVGSDGRGGKLELDRWYHVAYVIDAAACRLYLDGDLKKTLPFTGRPRLMRPGSELRIGDTGAGEHMDGVIDDVRIYREPLSDAQVRVLARP